MGRVCAEYVKYIKGPKRRFEAIVRDHYSEPLDTVTYTHPALNLGAHPRNGKASFIGRQILCFLEKLRLSTISSRSENLAKEPFTGPSSRTPDHAEPSPTPRGQGAARWIIAEFESRPPPDRV
ncbi:unnamed protein product [Heligmosomoides polygyrus]|uniref:Uracil-DNA glycosylase n=1 Tax=Heligmosomoides polygyrus TaxID=6339 RepID=A0A183GH25_HELPZ|nr:unnamed protein product [Heligmosomoides polygyrus]